MRSVLIKIYKRYCIFKFFVVKYIYDDSFMIVWGYMLALHNIRLFERKKIWNTYFWQFYCFRRCLLL